MQLILIAIALLALAFAGIAIKILVKKDGKFAGTCSSNNPLVQKEGASCGICGARPEEQCKAPDQLNSSRDSKSPSEK
ncbi:MAG: membrane or secreted protein [Bacteroidetes bacterium]|nr:membrane or secreted protein [Bacteroidota bacterium]HET6245969.1 membrane or secreted protein [Bacteroidia bacterium]